MPLVYGGCPAGGWGTWDVSGLELDTGIPLRVFQFSFRCLAMEFLMGTHFINTRFDFSGDGHLARERGRERFLHRWPRAIQPLQLRTSMIYPPWRG